MAVEFVILVDEQDRAIGQMEKHAAHEDGGVRHRAFSVFIFDSAGRWLLQQRAADKYHFPSIWSNACCSHPRPGEATDAAAHRRLMEELGFDCEITEHFSFEYRALSEATGLTEHEIDHVFTGEYEGGMRINPDEVAAVRWLSTSELEAELAAAPETFSPWFKIAFERVKAWRLGRETGAEN